QQERQYLGEPAGEEPGQFGAKQSHRDPSPVLPLDWSVLVAPAAVGGLSAGSSLTDTTTPSIVVGRSDAEPSAALGAGAAVCCGPPSRMMRLSSPAGRYASSTCGLT